MVVEGKDASRVPACCARVSLEALRHGSALQCTVPHCTRQSSITLIANTSHTRSDQKKSEIHLSHSTTTTILDCSDYDGDRGETRDERHAVNGQAEHSASADISDCFCDYNEDEAWGWGYDTAHNASGQGIWGVGEQ